MWAWPISCSLYVAAGLNRCLLLLLLLPLLLLLLL
jgi:hypothetical protein